MCLILYPFFRNMRRAKRVASRDTATKTKEKAQQYIGLDIDAEKAAKERFLKTTVPAWLEKAKSNGRLAQK